MGSNKIKNLTELSQLYRDGILTKEEFESEKQKLLASDYNTSLARQEKEYTRISERIASQSNNTKSASSRSFKEILIQLWAFFDSLLGISNTLVRVKTHKKLWLIFIISLFVVLMVKEFLKR